MTFPAIIETTQSPLAGAVAFAAGILAAWLGVRLLGVAAVCCITVLILELLV